MRKDFNFDDEQTEDGGYMDSSNYNDDDENEDDIDMDIDMMDYAQMDLMEIDLNQKLLNSALEIAKDSFVWYFMPINSKLKRIQLIYDKLTELVQSEIKNDSI